MEDVLSRHWWALFLRGLLAIALAVIAWSQPILMLSVLVIIFGVFAIADGIFAILAAMRTAKRQETWWPMVVEGVFGIILGIGALAAPRLGVGLVVLIFAMWALLTGAFEVAGAVRREQQVHGSWLLVLSALLRVAFGLLLLFWPGAGAQAIAWTIGTYAAVYGILIIAFSFRLRRHHAGVKAPGGRMTPQPV